MAVLLVHADSLQKRLAPIRRGLCAVAGLYFLSALGDVEIWYAKGAPASTSNLATFYRTAELESDARWMLSPLFVADRLLRDGSLGESSALYCAYLVIGIILAVLAGAGDRIRDVLPGLGRIISGSLPVWLLWIWFVGWANRIVLVAGICEPVLSVSLAALALAPVVPEARHSWRVTLATRLLAVQFTLIGLLTSATMLAGTVWWDGTGAYALVAPAEDRFISVRESFFETPIIYESLTAFLVLALPLGLLLSWRQSDRKIGRLLLWTWCVLVALLSANVIYALTLGVLVLTVGEKHHTSAGTNGAKTLDDEGVAKGD